MKTKKIIIKILIISLMMIVFMKASLSNAANSNSASLFLSYLRYTNGQYKDGYAYNLRPNTGKPIFQIMSNTNKTNYFCLNADAGDSWRNGSIGNTTVNYNKSYDLGLQSDLAQLKNNTNPVYSNIGNSRYLNQILWILDNMYVSSNVSSSSRLAQKRALLAKAGLKYDNLDFYGNEEEYTKYHYKPNQYNYSSIVSSDAKMSGYAYLDENGQLVQVEIPDELVEVAEQAALWYYTNYKSNPTAANEKYNVRSYGLKLLCSNGSNVNTSQWVALDGDTYKVKTYIEDNWVNVGEWKQEMATILCWYLIDSAEAHAGETSSSEVPLTVTPEAPNKANVEEKIVNGTSYYVVGPIRLDEQNSTAYTLANSISVNGEGAYISDSEGKKKSNQKVSNYVGTDFYVAVPSANISEKNINIGFSGSYKINEKRLWVYTNGTEQPVVEVTPKNKTFTLEVTAELTGVEVEKIWDDADDQDGKRPGSISVSLMNGDTVVQTVTLNESNNWKHVFLNLPKTANGVPINYTIKEIDSIEGYTTVITGDSANGYKITNKHIPEVTEVPVGKTWDDANNQDGKRTDSVIVELMNGNVVIQTITLNQANNWQHVFTNVPKYSKGKLINYTVRETRAPSSYDVEIVGNMQEGYTVINKHTPEKINIPVEKIWNDANNQDGKRVEKVVVQLLKGNEVIDTIELKDSNNWKHTFNDLPKYENGTEISYSVKEETVIADYTTDIIGNKDEGYKITNKHIPEVINIPVEKIWDDANNQDGKRVEKVKVQLLKGDTVVDSVDLNDANNWKYVFTNLPKYEKGKEIDYSVKEETVITDYTTETEGNKTEGFKITNKHTPEVINIPVEKIWNDANNQDGKRIESIRVSLLKGDTVLDTVSLNTNNNWKYVFTNLPKYEKGVEINYNIKEETVIVDYDSQIAGNKQDGFIITNTHAPEKVSIPVEKVWNDRDNKANKRPEYIELVLYGDGTEVKRQQVRVGTDGNWKYTFTDLDKYKNGKEIVYTIDEIEIANYEKVITGNAKQGYRIENTYKVFDLALRKNITKIEGKDIINEAGDIAKRNVNVISDTILDNGTATYNHRKDPVVVEKGDVITYTVSVYNEGNIAGYAETIVDKLPQGLTLKDYTEKNITTGVYEKGNVKYEYTYNPEDNTITFTNISKNILTPYNEQPGSVLSQEKIEIDCEVVKNPSTSKNAYLTNIAYITKAINSEKNIEVVEDRDSRTDKNPTENQVNYGDKYTGYHGSNTQKDVYTDGLNNDDYFAGQEDDDDFEVVVIKNKVYDFAIQKYISNVYTDKFESKGGRKAPIINTKELASGEKTTADYIQDKNPIKVKNGNYVVYNFTVYNEGEIEGFVNKITDNIPEGVQFVSPKGDNKTLTLYNSKGETQEVEVSSELYNLVSSTNTNWSIDKENGNNKFDKYNGENTISVTCDVSTYLDNKNNLKPFDKSKDPNFNGVGLDSLTVQLVLRVDSEDGTGRVIRNEAAITETKDLDGNIQDYTPEDDPLTDRDSQTNQWPGKDGDKKYQDDEDFDRIVLGKVDLALTKFIAAVSLDAKIDDGEYLTPNGNIGSKENPYNRATEVNTTPLKDGSATTAIYTRVKDPLTVPEEAYVLYNIRVYNEGEVDVYAGEVKDYLPSYLSYVDCDFNKNMGWSVGADGKTVKTSYLSSKNGVDKKLKAFDKEADDGKGSKLDYRDLQILARVKSNAPEKTKIINTAEITKYEDEDGKELPKDIDSKPENVTKKNVENREEDDDDWEVVQIKKKHVDLALTKFITAVSEDVNIDNGEYLTPNGNIGSKNNPYNRATKVDTTPLKNETATDAIYTRVKDPLPLPEKSYVLYNIRVYNEGEVDVYAGEVADYLPNYLDFVDCEFNDNYGWKLGTDGKTVKTSYLSHANGKDKILKAFDKEQDNGEGTGLDYKDLPILCQINSNAPDNKKLVNTAEITVYENSDGEKIPEDVDSKPENVTKKNVENREEDDDDWEVVIIKKKKVDLALTKFIAAVSDDTKIDNGEYLTQNGNIGSKENPYNRATKVDTTPLKNGTSTDAIYTMVKDPLLVKAKSYILYNIRVYNEGEADVYAGEVTDHLPYYLDYVDCDFNKEMEWKVAADGKTISTSKLSHENGTQNLLKAFNKAEDDGKGSKLDYRDLQIICRLNEKTPANTRIINVAEITKYENEEGNPIPNDVDSTPDNVSERNEDDDDYETVLIKTFDLSLLKYVTEVFVTEDGKTKITQTGNTGNDTTDIIPKVEVNKKKLNSTVVKFGYTIKITNEGEIAGYAKEITDYVPYGLKFYSEDNQGWVDEGNNVISTRLLENTYLQPGESAEVKVILRWINGTNNLGLKTNIAEISEDFNYEGVPDIDSEPDNRKAGEDDIDSAPVLLSIKTGLGTNIIIYATASLIILVIMGVGISIIKKFTL